MSATSRAEEQVAQVHRTDAVDNIPVWDDRRWTPLPPLEGDVDADYCVIGLGGSGLTAIGALLDRGQQVVGLDAHDVGAGAAGRNGGFLLAGAYDFYHDAVRLHGRERARGIYGETLTEIRRIADATPETVRFVGSRRLAATPEEIEDCRAQLQAMQEDDLACEWYDGEDGVGLTLPNDAAFNPLARCRTLARAHVARGAALHGTSPVIDLTASIEDAARRPSRSARTTQLSASSPSSSPSSKSSPSSPSSPSASFAPSASSASSASLSASHDIHVRTPTGSVRARRLIVAVDGGLERVVPSLAGRVRTARLQMLATAPTTERVVPCPMYYREGYEYWQGLPDGGIAIGGFRDRAGPSEWTFDAVPSAGVQRMLESFVREKLGVQAPITHRWAALAGYTSTGLPLLEEIAPNVWVIGGYSGTGNVIGALCGRAVVALAHDDDATLARTLVGEAARRYA